ncbi:MAG: hypothetical protein Q8L88_13150 [Bacteroidota bacterium]|nr:hypothetical protein [Bacteroidota bacterium]
MSYYSFQDFKEACLSDQSNVIVMGGALKDADTCFSLSSRTELLDFIANDGLEELEFINTKDWEKNPDKTNPIKVDAYKFKTLYTLGYIAFLCNSKNKKWIIKSFKLSDDLNPTMRLAFQNPSLLKKENKK